MRPVAVLVWAGVVLTSGCYRYVPAPLQSVEPGHAVRLRITAAEAERLEPLRQTLDRVVEGVVHSRAGDELYVDTSVGTLDPSRGTRAFTQRLNVSVAAVNEVELRRRDSLKTTAAIGAVGVAVGIGIAAALKGGEGGPRDPTEPVPEFRGRFQLRLAPPF